MDRVSLDWMETWSIQFHVESGLTKPPIQKLRLIPLRLKRSKIWFWDSLSLRRINSALFHRQNHSASPQFISLSWLSSKHWFSILSNGEGHELKTPSKVKIKRNKIKLILNPLQVNNKHQLRNWLLQGYSYSCNRRMQKALNHYIRDHSEDYITSLQKQIIYDFKV